MFLYVYEYKKRTRFIPNFSSGDYLLQDIFRIFFILHYFEGNAIEQRCEIVDKRPPMRLRRRPQCIRSFPQLVAVGNRRTESF
jgi:hypothetical protein